MGKLVFQKCSGFEKFLDNRGYHDFASKNFSLEVSWGNPFEFRKNYRIKKNFD